MHVFDTLPTELCRRWSMKIKLNDFFSLFTRSSFQMAWSLWCRRFETFKLFSFATFFFVFLKENMENSTKTQSCSFNFSRIYSTRWDYSSIIHWFFHWIESPWDSEVNHQRLFSIFWHHFHFSFIYFECYHDQIYVLTCKLLKRLYIWKTAKTLL